MDASCGPLQSQKGHGFPVEQGSTDVAQQYSAHWKYVFTVGGSRPVTFDNKKKLDAASGTSGWTLHDLRRTARSLMSRAGVRPDIGERCLGHVIGGVEGTYDRHDYLEQMADAFEKLAGEVEKIWGRG